MVLTKESNMMPSLAYRVQCLMATEATVLQSRLMAATITWELRRQDNFEIAYYRTKNIMEKGNAYQSNRA